jgi:hypothetical protein
LFAVALGLAAPLASNAQGHKAYKTYGSKPNIVMIVSDDTGYWDLGAYNGGKARGMDTPNLDALAREGMMFTDYYAQASCPPGRAAMQTGRYPNRSGMTTVAFQGQGGGLPAAEWTLASVLKKGGYNQHGHQLAELGLVAIELDLARLGRCAIRTPQTGSSRARCRPRSDSRALRSLVVRLREYQMVHQLRTPAVIALVVGSFWSNIVTP